MTNVEMKTVLKKAGVSAEEIKRVEEKFDVDDLCAIVSKAKSPDDAIKAICKTYTDIDAKKLKEQYDFYADQYEAASKEGKLQTAEQLSMGELEYVAGGASSKWSDGWRWRRIRRVSSRCL